MTPKDRAIAALNLKKPDKVPTMEIDFQLHDELEVKEKYGRRVCLMGNVDTTKLQMGTKEEIEHSAKYALKSGMPGGGYIFSSCNSIFEGIPLDNYLAMLRIRDKIGLY